MRRMFLTSLLGLVVLACTAPDAPNGEAEPPAPPAPPIVDDVEPEDGIVPGEEEVEVSLQPEDVESPEPPGDMAGVPALSDADYMIRSVGELGLKGDESPEAIGRLLRKRFGQPESAGGRYNQELEVFEDGADAVIVFMAEGMADDSVKAEQHVVQVFFPAAVPAGVTGYGVRYKCYRAEDPEAWQNRPCP